MDNKINFNMNMNRKPPTAGPSKGIKTRKLYSAAEMAQLRQKRLLSGDGGPSQLPKLAANSTKNEILNKLREMTGLACATNADKFQLLRRRDEFMSKLREICSDTEPGARQITQGTCPDMCPEKERYMRDVKKAVHAYECDARGVMVHEKMVKDYSRSAADQDMPLAHELRPLEALQTTMDYLIFNIANEMPATNQELARWYDFLWSRTRAIRKDITQQMLQNESAVDLVEKCVRLHIFASFKLGSLDAELFDHKINTENLSKSMQTLRHMYEDLAKKQRFCPNESEFRSYDILLNLADFNVHSQVLAYRPVVRESPEVQLALGLASALQNNNYIKFFRLVRTQASFLQACLSYQFFPHVRASALKVIVLAYQVFPLDALAEKLAFDCVEHANAFVHAFGINTQMDDPNLFSTRLARPLFKWDSEPPDIPTTVMTALTSAGCKWIEQKAMGLTLPQILCNNPLALPPPNLVSVRPVVNSFAPGTNIYTKDPVLDALFEAHGLPKPDVVVRMNESVRQQAVPPPPAFSFARGLRPFQTKIFPPRNSEFVDAQKEAILTDAVHSQLEEIAEHCVEAAVQARLGAIYTRQRRKWLLRFFTRWRQNARRLGKQRELHNAKIRMAGAVFLTVTDTQLESAATRALKEANAKARHQLSSEMAQQQSAELLEHVVGQQLWSIACRVRAAEIRDIQQRLTQIRQNLHKKWLRQFTDRWLEVVRRRKLLRSITLFPMGNTSPTMSPDGLPLNKPPRLYFPGIKPLTPQQLRAMAEQKMRQREEAEKQRAAEQLKLEQQNREMEVERQLDATPIRLTTSAQIRDFILDSNGTTSFGAASPASQQDFAESASKLRLFKPGAKQLTPECIRQMAEQKLREREIAYKQQQLQQKRKKQQEENGEDDFQDDLNQNGGESMAPSEQPISWEWLNGWRENVLKPPATQQIGTHQWQTGPTAGEMKRRRFF